MSLVGAFPNLADIHRMTVPQMRNPLDVTTIFSILPIKIEERKISIQPNFFCIAPGSKEAPAFLHVEGASWWKELDEKQPLLEIQVNSVVLAEAIVKDYCNGMIGFGGSGAKPGLFTIPGKVTVKQLREDYAGSLIKAIQSQHAWYQECVKLADALWSRTNGNPLAISDLMRMAAKELGLNKEWIQDFQTMQQERCIACGTMKSVSYPVCPTCRAITDPKAAEKLGIKFAVN